MLKRIITITATAVVLAGGLAATAEAAPIQVLAAAACHAHKVGGHWSCVTPGSYCPKAAHGKIGYAKKTSKRYRCAKYSNGRWRWKRA